MEVIELWRWPVTGAAGELTPSFRLDARGVGGDHAHVVLARGRRGWEPVAGAPAEALAAWRAGYPFAIGASLDPVRPPYAVLVSPHGQRYAWGDPRLRHALEDSLGCAVLLRRGGATDPCPARAVRITTPADGPVPAALGTNVHLDADPADLVPGHELRFAGGVRLRILARAPIAGLCARVVAAGRIAAGEPAELAAPADG
jgi:hypothetical protein